MDGILNINKHSGKTSFSIVDTVKRLSGEVRVGHGGTLDPMATGVLPVCLGRGTRIIEFLVDATKLYRAQIELGVATDTYDASGKTTQRGDVSGINQGQVESALNSFRGLIRQSPPAYSAVKHQGKPLYEWIRAGIKIEKESRLVRIHRLELIDWEPPVVTIEVVCGRGTYIRSLAHDLGQALGCGANLKSLIRLRYGLFNVKEAISLSQLEDAFCYGYWQRFVYPIDIVVSHWTAMVVSDADSRAIRDGRPLALEKASSIDRTAHLGLANRCRAYTTDGCFVGVLGFNPETGQWHPEKVFL